MILSEQSEYEPLTATSSEHPNTCIRLNSTVIHSHQHFNPEAVGFASRPCVAKEGRSKFNTRPGRKLSPGPPDWWSESSLTNCANQLHNTNMLSHHLQHISFPIFPLHIPFHSHTFHAFSFHTITIKNVLHSIS